MQTNFLIPKSIAHSHSCQFDPKTPSFILPKSRRPTTTESNHPNRPSHSHYKARPIIPAPHVRRAELTPFNTLHARRKWCLFVIYSRTQPLGLGQFHPLFEYASWRSYVRVLKIYLIFNFKSHEISLMCFNF